MNTTLPEAIADLCRAFADGLLSLLGDKLHGLWNLAEGLPFAVGKGDEFVASRRRVVPAYVVHEAALGVEITESEMGPNKMGFFPMEMGALGAAGSLVLVVLFGVE